MLKRASFVLRSAVGATPWKGRQAPEIMVWPWPGGPVAASSHTPKGQGSDPPSQGTHWYPVVQVHPQSGSMQGATDLCFSFTSMFLYKINKYTLGWGLKIYTLKWKEKRNVLLGQEIGQSPGFSYTHANKKKGITWEEMWGESQEGPPWNKSDLCWH